MSETSPSGHIAGPPHTPASPEVRADPARTGFCVYPSTVLEVNPAGQVRPCCLFQSPFHDDDGAPFDVRAASLAAVWRSSAAVALRRRFAAAESDERCERCWEVERHGGASRRLTTLRRQQRHLAPALAGVPVLRQLQLNPGNRCNLKCRTCHPSASSAWRSEWRAVSELARAHGSIVSEVDGQEPITDWAADPARIWDGLEGIAGELEEVEVHGGEPMLITEHFELLRRLIAAGRAGAITLHYNTNGTRLPTAALELWRSFRAVRVQVSLDGVGPRFEFMRFPAKWREVSEHVSQLATLPFVDLSVNATVSALNALYIDELLRWAATQRLRVELQPLGNPAWYDLRALPLAAKAEVVRRWTGARALLDPATRGQIDHLESRMMSDDWWAHMGRELSLRTYLHDDARGQRVEHSMPDLAAFLQPRGDLGLDDAPRDPAPRGAPSR